MLRLHRNILTKFVRLHSTANSTLSDDELLKFSKLANDWWNVNGPFKALHSLNQLRVPFVLNGIQSCQPAITANPPHSPLANCSILDIGCGGGLLSECLARLGANVTALDPCEESIIAAKLHSEKVGLDTRIQYNISTIEEFKGNYPEAKYEAITASEVIEHLENPLYFMDTCSSLLKPGGSIFLTTINRTTASWAFGIIAAEYLLNLVPQGTHDWNKFITVDEMASYLRDTDLQPRQLAGMAYNPLTNNWSWTRSLCINYAVHATKRKSETASDGLENSTDQVHKHQLPSQAL